jgi:CBS domain-containing protein
MRAQDIMTKKVISAAEDSTVEQVTALMLKNQISAVPILNRKGAVVGLVSEGDLMRRVEGMEDGHKSWWLRLFSGAQTASDFVAMRGRHAKDIMTRDVKVVAPDTPVAEIARLLEEQRIKRVPVVKDGELLGIVSRANLLQALAASPVVELDDETGAREKRDIVLKALAEVPGLDTTQLNVVVGKDHVDVWGLANSDAEVKAARVALDNIEGLGRVSINLAQVPAYVWGI